MPLFRPIRYINDGEPLNETVLNRSTVDVQENLEELFNLVDGYDGGVSEASPLRVILRDEQGTAKFGVPSNEQHPIRVVEFEDFKDFLLDADDLVRNERLPKASTTLEGIVQLIDSYTDTSLTKAPTADALRRGLESVKIDLATSISDPDTTNDEATTPKAVYEFVDLKGGQWKNDWESYADDVLNSAKTYTDNSISTIDTGGSDVGLASAVFMNDTRGTSDGLATTPKAVWDAIEAYAGVGDGATGPTEVEGKSFNNGENGWLKFPTAGDSGIIVQWGGAITNNGGRTVIAFPTSFSNTNYALTATEGNVEGWISVPGLSYPYAVPTIYGQNKSNATNGSVEIIGLSIDYTKTQPEGRKGLYFNWIAIGT